MQTLMLPDYVVKCDKNTMMLAGFDHEIVRDRAKILAQLNHTPYSEEYTLMEHKETGARAIWIEMLFLLCNTPIRKHAKRRKTSRASSKL